MISITAISDLHGHFPILEGGDLLIVAGDFTAGDTEKEHVLFCYRLNMKNYRKKIIVAGNHDNGWVGQKPHKGLDPINPNYEWYEYLCDSGTEFEGLKIWGSPWTKKFNGMNPKCMAFTVDTDEELAEKWDKIPLDTDILITHCPPYGIMDSFKIYTNIEKGVYRERCGSVSLRDKTEIMKNRLHVFGHIHAGHGKIKKDGKIWVNAAHMDEIYDPVNEPIRIEL